MSVGATWDVVSPRVLGVVGFVFNYQMAYGTVLYFSNYLLNRLVHCSRLARPHAINIDSHPAPLNVYSVLVQCNGIV